MAAGSVSGGTSQARLCAPTTSSEIAERGTTRALKAAPPAADCQIGTAAAVDS